MNVFDTIVVGAGAAGLATAIFARRGNPRSPLLLLDGAARPGAKILVSGGSRCNVTNVVVGERDYWGGPAAVVRRVLRAFPAPRAVAFFADEGVALHEEADGKLFPDSNRSRDVLDALLGAATGAGVDLRGGHRVTGVTRQGDRFVVSTASTAFAASRVVLATGGRSLPKSGSDGAGYDIARALGHTVVPITPALSPLVLDGTSPHRRLSGVAADVTLALRVDGRLAIRLGGSMLWTHFGISGPVALNASRHWLRARLEGRDVSLTAALVPGWEFQDADTYLLDEAQRRPRASVATLLAGLVPASVADVVADACSVDAQQTLAQLGRDDRRTIARALTEWPLPVVESRGWNYAEATAGGVDLREINAATMASRVCPGLFLVGEILDVDGRLGGFNFQWAWSSAFVAGRALAT